MRRLAAVLPDLVPAAILLLIGIQEVWFPFGTRFSSPRGPRWALTTHIVLIAAALLWRRRRPLATATAVNALLVVEALAFGSPDGLAEIVPVGIALHSVGRHAGVVRLLLAFGASAANGVVHAWRDPETLPAGPQLTMWAAILATGLVGRFIAVTSRTSASYAVRAEAAERERDDRIRAAAPAERARIAHELHDLVGHGISVVVLQAVGAQAALEHGDAGAAMARLARLESSARMTMAEMRRLLAVVGADDGRLTPQPGVDDIRGLVGDLGAAGVPVHLTVDRGDTDIPAASGWLPSGSCRRASPMS